MNEFKIKFNAKKKDDTLFKNILIDNFKEIEKYDEKVILVCLNKELKEKIATTFPEITGRFLFGAKIITDKRVKDLMLVGQKGLLRIVEYGLFY